ncbi:MAG: outer membrane protein assembly factor [Bacteroidales bacterium]|nr:outer membrane protein assembly factor [Bacteroidales bacterium]
MKRNALAVMAVSVLLLAVPVSNARDKSDVVKKGYNLGPLPAIAYDADKGVQIGAVLQLFNYGDGSEYPAYNSKAYVEYSYFTKGSHLIQLRYDNRTLIPGIRWSSTVRASIDKARDFYGFNGYASSFDINLPSAFYRCRRNDVLVKSDFLGVILPHFRWEAGIFFNYFGIKDIDIDNLNRGKAEEKQFHGDRTLYSIYRDAGILGVNEAGGGYAGGIRAGLEYDTRDKEGAPSRGIWAEGHVSAALPGLSSVQHYRYSLTFRHYVPIVSDDVLTFAYRLNYEGTFGKNAPYYSLSYMTAMGERCDFEGMGGYQTVRGIMRSRVVGLDMATYNAEFRWRFYRFNLWKQNFALAFNLFSDGTMVTRNVDLSALPQSADVRDTRTGDITTVQLKSDRTADRPHITFGAGLRLIMNENFIIAAEYGMPVSRLLKNSPIRNQDGTGAFYFNVGYLF